MATLYMEIIAVRFDPHNRADSLRHTVCITALLCRYRSMVVGCFVHQHVDETSPTQLNQVPLSLFLALAKPPVGGKPELPGEPSSNAINFMTHLSAKPLND